jgi:hypothetical protein
MKLSRRDFLKFADIIGGYSSLSAAVADDEVVRLGDTENWEFRNSVQPRYHADAAPGLHARVSGFITECPAQ